MNKIVVIGDIHGCDKWKQVMQAHGDATEFVFIGDYFDSFTRNHAECIHNFRTISLSLSFSCLPLPSFLILYLVSTDSGG